jgi:hypothetical protein
MKKWLLILVFSSMFVVQSRADEAFSWMSDLDEAKALAAETDKPLLVVFRCEP